MKKLAVIILGMTLGFGLFGQSNEKLSINEELFNNILESKSYEKNIEPQYTFSELLEIMEEKISDGLKYYEKEDFTTFAFLENAEKEIKKVFN